MDVFSRMRPQNSFDRRVSFFCSHLDFTAFLIFKFLLELFNPIQDGHFRGCSRMGEGKNLSHISYSDETWHSYTLPKEDPKSI